MMTLCGQSTGCHQDLESTNAIPIESTQSTNHQFHQLTLDQQQEISCIIGIIPFVEGRTSAL